MPNRERGVERLVGHEREVFTMGEKTIVIVEDDALVALDLRYLCQDAGCRVLGVATTAAEARQMFPSFSPDVLISDYELADGSDGVAVAEHLRKLRADVTVIFVTGTTEPDKLQRIERFRPHRVLKKPLRIEELHEALSADAG